MNSQDLKKYLTGALVAIILFASVTSGIIADRLFEIKFLDSVLPKQEVSNTNGQRKIVKEESAVIDVVDSVSNSVVTVSIQTPQRRVLEFTPFGGLQSRLEGGTPQDIGSGFVVDGSGLIVTNKHVVSDVDASYKVVTKDNQEFEVSAISRDPNNDIAILKINASSLEAIELGDSSELKVGQFVVAIGTALGEFRHTVTTGVISGLGRGISAGNPFQGFIERLDDVIQTDAAINPGNSGGPLLNSSGQVIGVNVAVASGAQNISFAIPINIVKEGLTQFEETGNFAPKPFLGVQYQIISEQASNLNEVPQGAFIVELVANSAAAKAGLLAGDIITKFNGNQISEQNDLSEAISQSEVGVSVEVEIWRDGENLTFSVVLEGSSE